MPDQTHYGFQAHLGSNFPSQIIIDVTEYCNLACIHCPHEAFSKSDAFGGRQLDPGLHKKLIDEVAKDGKGCCKFLRYTGQGETLIHPKLVEMVEYAGKYSGVPINVTTNGILLVGKKARALLDAGVNVFDISIDANTAETYAIVRKKGDLNITRQNVLALIELVKKGGYEAKVVVSYIEQPLNQNETSDFEKFWNENGADYVVIRNLHSCAGSKEEIANKMKNSFIEKRRPCLYPWERLVLSASGHIGFCPADWKHQSHIIAFSDTTIKELWQGDFMRKLREAHLKNDFSNHHFCGQCPDWAATKWPQQGRSYSNMMRELVPADLIETE